MPWTVLFHDEFRLEFEVLPRDVRRAMMVVVQLLMERGPHLGRPHADTLKGTRSHNLKEMRFSAGGGIWRVAFAFDPARRAILLVGGNKTGRGKDRFYRQLIATAESRYQSHLDSLAGGGREKRPWR